MYTLIECETREKMSHVTRQFFVNIRNAGYCRANQISCKTFALRIVAKNYLVGHRINCFSAFDVIRKKVYNSDNIL